MTNDDNLSGGLVENREKEIGLAIQKKVLKLERSNYLQKPEGLSGTEMVERIKDIIEKEVGK